MDSWNAFKNIGITSCTRHWTLDLVHWTIAYGCTMVLCLIMVCASYLAIRAKLHDKIPANDASHCNSQYRPQQNARFFRTLFVEITASRFFWLPSIVIYCTHYLCSACVPQLLFQVFNSFRLTNSLVFLFRGTFKRMNSARSQNNLTSIDIF